MATTPMLEADCGTALSPVRVKTSAVLNSTENDFCLPYWGDADRLANGNILVAAGVRDATKQSRLFEVRRDDGQVVWEIALPADSGCFRAQRISPPPLVQRLG